MTKRYRMRHTAIMVAPVIAGMILSCLILSVRKERLVSSEWHDYMLEPATLLESLEQGKTDVFIPLTVTYTLETSTPSPLIHWSQEDYERIILAFFNIVLKEPIKSWNLLDVEFSLDCANVDRETYTDAQFRFFKIIHARPEESKIERHILIFPLQRSLSWYDQEWYPKVTDWTPLHLAQFEVSAEEALQIAEKNGGADARAAVNNECTISSAAGLIGLKGWNTIYTSSNNIPKNLFDVDIDPVSGEITRIKR